MRVCTGVCCTVHVHMSLCLCLYVCMCLSMPCTFVCAGVYHLVYSDTDLQEQPPPPSLLRPWYQTHVPLVAGGFAGECGTWGWVCPFFLKLYLFSGTGLCCMHFFSGCSKWGYSLVVEHELLIAEASLAVEYELQGVRGFSSCSAQLSRCNSWALEHRLNSCGARGLVAPVACGIFPDQRLNLCLLY